MMIKELKYMSTQQRDSYVLALDPSGNFDEGKGTTGWCLMRDYDALLICTGHVSAKDYKTAHDYWHAHIKLLQDLRLAYNIRCVVLEDYLLYANKANSQTNSRFETPQLIGIIKYWCATMRVYYVTQPAALVKTRWANTVLEHKGILQRKGTRWYCGKRRINRHEVDAIRHAMHYCKFKIW